jgi:hypothetical protein
MKSILARAEQVPWRPGAELYGPGARREGVDLVQVKVLSDRRREGGGLAYLVKFAPPAQKLLKIIAVARSEEHTYVLEGGYCNKSGEQLRFPGDYGCNPPGHPHSAFIGHETVSLVVYSGEPDEVREFSVVDLTARPAPPAS